MMWILFAIFLCACVGAGATGGLFPPDEWYRRLKKPTWTPPDWVFPVTWFVLYVCMALAAARVAQLPGNGFALAFWALQIALNALWTPVFFGRRKIRMGMAVVMMLWLSVAGTLITMWQIDFVAGILFVPYLIWVTIAAALNAEVWRLNPTEARIG
ncbi:MAG: tryptophan-rich sensory protein [Aestuariivita sp.]|nr:tryptophan-rich sensory protein [Aestuariivita sp.]MCY4202976.1 tryptophan-rich sensory protein [Aestuariivita sp.]